MMDSKSKEEKKKLYSGIVESSNDAIIATELNGSILSWNEGAEKLYGFQAAEILGSSIASLIPAQGKKEISQFLAKIKEGIKLAHFGTVHLKKDGAEIKVSASLSPIKDSTGRVVAAAFILRSIPFVRQEQKKFELAVEAAPNGMLMIDGSGRMKLVNAQIEHMFGYSREALLGQPVEILVPMRFRKEHPGYRKEFFKDPQARLMGAGRDLYGLRSDGIEFPVEIGLNPLITEEGSFVLASVVDITERKKEQEKFRLAMEATPAGVLMVNEMGEIELANQQILHMFKYRKEDLIGQKVEVLIPERFRQSHPKYRNVYFMKPQTRPMGTGRDLYGLRSDGSEFPVEIGLNPLTTDTGPFVLASVIDITGRKLAEDMIKKSNEELERFAYVVSHDLKAPLRGIATVSEWIVEEYQDKLDDKGKNYLGLLDNRVKLLQALIDGILEYSRIGRMREEPEKINLNKMVKEIISALMPPESFHIKIEKQLPLIYAEKIHIYQLFQNIISNAIKYNDKKEGIIKIGVNERPKAWEFFVKDNGIGIEEQYKNKIFELFQTLENKEKYHSTGVGLTLAKKIVELYNGSIWFNSKIGKGTTFYFTLNKEKLSEG